MDVDASHRARRADDGRESSRPLSDATARATRLGVAAVGVGVALMAVSFLTNPVPDPSFPWATLPARYRVPYAQPRIEHWPVTYTVGLWLVVFAFPSLLLAAYDRYAPRFDLGPRAWLVAVPASVMLAFTTYCRFFWPKLHPATWNAPSYTVVCWGYCSTYDPAWSNLAYGVAALGVVAFGARESPWGTRAQAAFGVLALPLGAPALLDAYRRRGS